MKVACAFKWVALLTATGASAGILDPGFEQPQTPAWTLTSSANAFFVVGPDAYHGNPGLVATGRGSQFMRAYYSAESTGWSKVSQVLSDTVAAQTRYILSVDVANNAGGSKTLPGITDTLIKESGGMELPLVSFVKPTRGNTLNPGYVRWTKTYRTGSKVLGGAICIELFTSQNPVAGLGNDRFAAFDNVSLTIDPPPKPSSLALVTNQMIFNHGKIGSWDANQVEEPCILVNPKDATKLIMFYSGAGSGGVAAIGVAWANVSDPYTWHLHSGNPVFTKGRSGWDKTNIRLDCVLYNSASDEYWIYYSGSRRTGIADHIGLAKCPAGRDGYANIVTGRITRYSTNPILSPGGPGRTDETAVSQCAVLKNDAIHWYMYYSYRTASLTLPGIRQATSADGMTWTKRTGADVFAATPNAYYEWHQIFKVGNTYVLSMEVGPNHGARWRPVLAYSLNPASGWVQSSPELIQQTTWPNYGDDVTTKFFHVATPAFYQIDGNWFMYYQAAPGGAYISQSWAMWTINCQRMFATAPAGATMYLPAKK
jgi:hypothetical protein